MPSVVIKGMGAYAPKNVVTNEDLSQIVDTSDEWIRTRTGIGERHLADESETVSFMASEAAKEALENSGLSIEEIDLLIVATMTPDMLFPSTACLVQSKLGLKKVASFDIEAACSGFLYALEVGSSMLKAGAYKNALIIGSEKISGIVDWQDRTTCVLFGDGAGAAVLSKSEEPDIGVLGALLRADGDAAHLLHMPGGGSNIPASSESLDDRQHFLKMNGKEIFKVAVRYMEQATLDLLESKGLTIEEIDCVIPHQANMRIIDSLGERLGVPKEKFVNNLVRYGNTSAASIPIALTEAVKLGKLKKGDHLLLIAFGAGLTWGASLIKWT
jgi:3-oxoacyl-[acyl-carrier-protein] synthase-3